MFDTIAAPEDLDVVIAVESLTNPRLRQEIGEVSLVPPEERITGSGSTLVMAAFTHLNPVGSRFSDGRYGVYYAAESLETAIAEVSHHRAIFLERTAEPEIDVDLRWIHADVIGRLHELRNARVRLREVYDPDSYAASQAFGGRLRDSGSAGVIYHSVRRAGGECVAVFRPKALARAASKGHIALHWNGSRITHWYGKDEPSAM